MHPKVGINLKRIVVYFFSHLPLEPIIESILEYDHNTETVGLEIVGSTVPLVQGGIVPFPRDQESVTTI